MPLDRLLGGVDVVEVRGNPADVGVRSITFDTSDVVPGALHCCLPGARVDGHDLAEQAVAAGATALLCERMLPLDVVQARVPQGQVRPAMAQVAASYWGHPASSLVMTGVTGTNGKTTVTHLLSAILEAHGWPTEVIGTLHGARTTPESPLLQRMLAELRDRDGRAVAMEVSSHALAQHRVDGVRFAVACFTNLSRDHLDYHGTMEAYFEAKADLFTPERAEAGVVNADDPWGRRLLADARIPLEAFSLDDAGDPEVGPTSTTFTWGGHHRVSLGLGGRFNLANALAAATMARYLGVPGDTVAAGLSAVRSIPGRLEVVSAGQPFTVLVDYAHTPAALEQALEAARLAIVNSRPKSGCYSDHFSDESCDRAGGGGRSGGGRPGGAGGTGGAGKVIVVFGAGGDRDRTKRPLLAEVATRLADRVYLTSDNARHEDPLTIMAEVARGAGRPGVLVAEPDRATAIARALEDATDGDVVLVAGKGHETTQDMAGHRAPFDDRAVARAILQRRYQPAGASPDQPDASPNRPAGTGGGAP